MKVPGPLLLSQGPYRCCDSRELRLLSATKIGFRLLGLRLKEAILRYIVGGYRTGVGPSRTLIYLMKKLSPEP